jgi:two-component system response regulator HydG
MYAPYAAVAAQREPSHSSAESVLFPDDREIQRAARTDACILFTGPVHVRTLALRIHTLSGWRWGPFHGVDCSEPAATLEVQLFGVLESNIAPGRVAPAVRLLQPGTMFLHEVGRLSLEMQARFCNLLGDSAWRRSHRSRPRIMASTSESLLPRVADGSFDDRLFYLLNVLHFVLPPANE